MAKTANLYVRIDPELKERAESILSSLGISPSSAITMFYRQVVLHNGLPFEIKLPPHPLDISRLTEEELDAELEIGYQEAINGEAMPADEVFADLYRKYGI